MSPKNNVRTCAKFRADQPDQKPHIIVVVKQQTTFCDPYSHTSAFTLLPTVRPTSFGSLDGRFPRFSRLCAGFSNRFSSHGRFARFLTLYSTFIPQQFYIPVSLLPSEPTRGTIYHLYLDITFAQHNPLRRR
jgi:hypothetical protein